MENDKFENDLEETATTIDVARLYYVHRKNQKDIVDKLGLSQSEVSRRLKKARELELIRFSISPLLEIDLGKKLKEKYDHLHEVIVEQMPLKKLTNKDVWEILGFRGANFFYENVKPYSRIGFSCGNTLNALAKDLEIVRKKLDKHVLESCKIFALVHPCLKETVDPTPASLVSMAARQLPGSEAYAYQFPRPSKEVKGFSSVELFRQHPDIKTMLEEMKKLDYYFIGIGNVDRAAKSSYASGGGLHFNRLIAELDLLKQIEKFRAIGECDHQPYDKDGNLLIEKKEFKVLRDYLIYLPLDILQNHVISNSSKVVAIAGGGAKFEAIYAALKAKFFNYLITDAITAYQLIKRTEDEENGTQANE